MASCKISEATGLNYRQKTLLKRGNIKTTDDLLLTPPNEIARRCKTSPAEVRSIVDAFCRSSTQILYAIEDIKHEGDEKFTTGDARLDEILGGGIRTGMLWEVAGESAAGKTQFALQLSLLVQLPPKLGGLSGAACYLTTSSTLPTSRLVQISESHPLLSPSLCGLSHVHTISTPIIPVLIRVLSSTLPEFVAAQSSDTRPIKLVIIDALAELFHSSAKTTTVTLVERSRNISEISVLLHTLASKYQLAVLVLNEVVDAFAKPPSAEENTRDLVYAEQSRWFNRADSIPLEDTKEVSLGLVWANQVNARMLLSRTGRRRYLSEDYIGGAKLHKASHVDNGPAAKCHESSIDQQPTLIRRLSVIFSSVASPASLDYIVTAAGISTLPDDGSSKVISAAATSDHRASYDVKRNEIQPPSASQLAPLDVGAVEDAMASCKAETEDEDDDWEQYWKDDVIPEDVYSHLTLDLEIQDGNGSPPSST